MSLEIPFYGTPPQLTDLYDKRRELLYTMSTFSWRLQDVLDEGGIRDYDIRSTLSKLHETLDSIYAVQADIEWRAIQESFPLLGVTSDDEQEGDDPGVMEGQERWSQMNSEEEALSDADTDVTSNNGHDCEQPSPQRTGEVDWHIEVEEVNDQEEIPRSVGAWRSVTGSPRWWISRGSVRWSL